MERKITLMLADDGVTMEIEAGDVDHGSGVVVVVGLSPDEARSLARRLGAAADDLQAGNPPDSAPSINQPTSSLTSGCRSATINSLHTTE